MSKTAVRGTLLHCVDDPWVCAQDAAYQYFDDGLVIFDDGRFVELGHAVELVERYPDAKMLDYRGYLIVPGFIDAHIHYAQTRIIGSFGRELLDWLATYTFPEELKFRSKAYAAEVADFFFSELAKVGTTAVQSFATTSPSSVEAFFDEAKKRNIRAICGLTGLDRDGLAPPDYLDTPESFYEGSCGLIDRYHGKGRLLYAITPRFAFGSTHEQMQMAGRLAQEYPELWIQTHLSENPTETRRVVDFFDGAKDYLEIYERYGLVRRRASFGHSIYLSEDEFARMGRAGASITFCPSSNLFLGSGHFRWDRANHHGVRWAVGTDSGGGNSMSCLRTLDDAYKVGMTQAVTADRGQDEEALRLSAVRALYAITLGAARCLDLEDCLGSFHAGKEADFVVLDPGASALLDFRRSGVSPSASASSALSQFFGAMMLWVPEVVKATFIGGQRAFER